MIINIYFILVISFELELSESGSESCHKSIIDRETKTKKGKYLGDEISNIQILLSDGARLNAARHVLMPSGQC